MRADEQVVYGDNAGQETDFLVGTKGGCRDCDEREESRKWRTTFLPGYADCSFLRLAFEFAQQFPGKLLGAGQWRPDAVDWQRSFRLFQKSNDIFY